MSGLLGGRRLLLIWGILPFAALTGYVFLPDRTILLYSLHALLRFVVLFSSGALYYLTGFKGFKSRAATAIAGSLLFGSLFSTYTSLAGFALFGPAFLLSIGLRSRKWKVARAWPDISYGVYLYGWPVQKMIHWNYPQLGVGPLFIASLAVTLVCGYLSWILIERRFIQLKVKGDQRGLIAESH